MLTGRSVVEFLVGAGAARDEVAADEYTLDVIPAPVALDLEAVAEEGADGIGHRAVAQAGVRRSGVDSVRGGGLAGAHVCPLRSCASLN